MDAPGCEVCGL